MSFEEDDDVKRLGQTGIKVSDAVYLLPGQLVENWVLIDIIDIFHQFGVVLLTRLRERASE